MHSNGSTYDAPKAQSLNVINVGVVGAVLDGDSILFNTLSVSFDFSVRNVGLCYVLCIVLTCVIVIVVEQVDNTRRI